MLIRLVLIGVLLPLWGEDQIRGFVGKAANLQFGLLMPRFIPSYLTVPTQAIDDKISSLHFLWPHCGTLNYGARATALNLHIKFQLTLDSHYISTPVAPL